jgi:hypothetical protein
MSMMRKLILGSLLLCGGFSANALADSADCATFGGTLLSWPATNPIWEMCWLPPSQSVFDDGSGMELRDVHWKGHLVMRRAHAPMLFAEYRSSTCYRDWKDAEERFLADEAVQNQLGIPVDPKQAITSCDRSHDPTAAYGNCPFQLAGYPGNTPKCDNGVSIEDGGDHVTLTTQHSAAWYQYTSRWTFWADGRMEPEFGFGNNDGTGNETTHWHHNYWRMEFAIDDDANTVSENGVDQASEFSALRDADGGPGGEARTWEVRNPETGNGYRLVPGAADYNVPTNESGRGFHNVDFMATQRHNGEYADISNNPLGACAMNDGALVNGESLVDTDVALYYTVAVRDSTHNDWPPGCTGSECIPQDSMICKKAGPTIVPFGPWVDSVPAVPGVAVDPGSVEAVVANGETTTDLFGIRNSGDPGSVLEFTLDVAPVSCDAPAAIAWLGASPASGEVAAGATSMATVAIDATELAPGEYSAFACVHSNDPSNALVSVPIQVTVTVNPAEVILIDGFDGGGGIGPGG